METREVKSLAQEQVGMTQVSLKLKSFCLNALHYFKTTCAYWLLLLQKKTKVKKRVENENKTEQKERHENIEGNLELQ